MNKDIYLFEFDISYSGQKTLFKKKKLFDYFKAYLLIADHIYLQASAPMKIKEVYDLFVKFEQCFKYNHIDEVPLVSFVLSKNIHSYEEYLDQRLKKLSNAHIDPKKNFEYNAYNVNNAQELVKSLDKKIIYGDSGYYFKKRYDSADKLFRKNVSKLFKGNNFIKLYNIDNKIQNELLKYPHEMELFQTFELGKIFKNNLKLPYHHKLTEEIRLMYYKANQDAVHANSSILDEHFKLKYIMLFYKMVGIHNYLIKIDTCEKINLLRENVHFEYLKTIFFKTVSKESLKELKQSFELGGVYKFIHFSYDWLIPIAMFFLLNGIQAYASVATYTLFKDSGKNILQNIINRWLSTIPGISEYKIYEEKKLLLQSLSNA